MIRAIKSERFIMMEMFTKFHDLALSKALCKHFLFHGVLPCLKGAPLNENSQFLHFSSGWSKTGRSSTFSGWEITSCISKMRASKAFYFLLPLGGAVFRGRPGRYV